MAPEKTFTTFGVAKICGVYHTTVINWANKGKLKAYTTPGGHRRIRISDLLEFMRAFDMPIPGDLARCTRKVFIVEDDPAVSRMLVRALRHMPQTELQSFKDGMEALIAVGKEAPDLLILDMRIPQVDGFQMCRLLRSNEHTRPARIIAVSGATLSSEEEATLREYADHFFRKPLSTAALRTKVADLLELDEASASS